MTDDSDADYDTAIHRDVVITPNGTRYHRIPHSDTARVKDAACGGFNQTKLETVDQSEAEARGYTACRTCDWVEVPAR